MRVGVIGAGAMGAGIAQVAASCGHEVVVVDVDAESLVRAREAIEVALARDVEKGRRAKGEPAAIIARIAFESSLAKLTAAEVVIEAVVESLDVKREVFRRLSLVVSEEAIIATNTSSLSIAAIASVCTHAERVIGIHFFNPAPVMPLVEIIPWQGTDPAVTKRSRALIDSWKKTTVLASDTPGFIVNRVARPYYGESLRIRDEGIADIATIDWALRTLGGFRMGPFELMDFIGLDVNFAVTMSVFTAFFSDPRFRPSLTQQRLVEAGLLGRKTERGFYDYRPGAAKPDPKTDETLGQTIVDRVLAMLVNEAVDAAHWGVASPADVDLAVTKGVNYPKGLFVWGQELGFDVILARLRDLQEEYGEDRYRPSVLLKRIVREGLKFV